ncbi:MAG: hypothetical protein J3Q66DRAFT_390185 [Benniella sp.]|nr:MAG: hypothetical protein J3Q66DRAFT_390185 [Benniella sp.]
MLSPEAFGVKPKRSSHLQPVELEAESKTSSSRVRAISFLNRSTPKLDILPNTEAQPTTKLTSRSTLVMAMEAFGIEPRKRRPTDKALPYRVSALEIPEILECIFGFLAPSQIRFGPRLVCKLWRTVSFNFSGNVLSWETSLALPESSFLRGVIEKRLRSTSTLRCTFKPVAQLTWDATRKALCSAINNLTTKEQQQIRELHYIEDGQVFKLDGGPFKPLHLATLHVSACRLFYMDIGVLWSAFPHLRVLSVWNTSKTSTRSNLHWKKPPSDSPHNLKLRSLRLRQVSMASSLLHTLLRYCPELNELKLVEIEFSSEPTTATKKVTFKEHLDAIVNLKPSLETFHFSMAGVDDTPTKLQAIASIASAFPCLKSFSVLAEDLNIPLNSEHILLGLGFTTLIQQLTTLELLANRATDIYSVQRSKLASSQSQGCISGAGLLIYS